MYQIAKAVPIPIKNLTEHYYGLNNMQFDPAQNSPPSLWKMRLNTRIGETPLKKSKPSTT
jgi:hypothetical protein